MPVIGHRLTLIMSINHTHQPALRISHPGISPLPIFISHHRDAPRQIREPDQPALWSFLSNNPAIGIVSIDDLLHPGSISDHLNQALLIMGVNTPIASPLRAGEQTGGRIGVFNPPPIRGGSNSDLPVNILKTDEPAPLMVQGSNRAVGGVGGVIGATLTGRAGTHPGAGSIKEPAAPSIIGNHPHHRPSLGGR